MKIIAHRGGDDIFPQQTIAAARKSLELGVDLAEVDIRFTSDGVPVTNHDPNLVRLYGSEANVCDLTATEFLAMRRLEDPSYASHRFADYIACGIKNMLFHCKEGGEQLDKVVAMCEQAGILETVVFGVQSPEDAKRMKAAGAKVLAFMPKVEQIEEFAAAGADYIRLWQEWCSDENIAGVHATGKKLWIMARVDKVGEVSGEEDYRFFEQTGADGILINKVIPALAYYKK